MRWWFLGVAGLFLSFIQHRSLFRDVFYVNSRSLVNLDLSPHCLMWQNYTSESEPNSKIHPFETFCLSMDDREYSDFESTIIRPSIRAARYRDALFTNSHLTELPVTFAPGCQSIVNIQCFLVDTNYNWSPINIHPHSFGETTPMPQVIPLDRVFYIKGYFSKKQLGCFVWEEGHSEDGEQVIFGTSGRLGRVLGVRLSMSLGNLWVNTGISVGNPQV